MRRRREALRRTTSSRTPRTTPRRRGGGAFLAAIGWVLGTLAGTASVCAQQAPQWQFTDAQLGFNDTFKLGCWTQLSATLAGGTQAWTGHVEATLTDSDGVPTVFRTPAERPIGLIPGQETTCRMLVRPGQQYAAMTLRFFSDDGRQRATRRFEMGYERSQWSLPYGRVPAARLIVAIGSAGVLADTVRSDAGDDNSTGTILTRVEKPADLPLEWVGYEGITTVFIAASQSDFFRQLPATAPRIEALARWVELGGQLVITGGPDAQETLSESGALRRFLPGSTPGLAPLRRSTSLEIYSGSSDLVTAGQLDLRVTRLTDIKGQILAYEGRNAEDLPLVVRQRMGLGTVTFAAFDIDRAPFDQWNGRQNLMRRLLGWRMAAAGQGGQEPQTDPFDNQGDLSGQLQTALDRNFAGVQPVPFALVALLVGIYILLIGPGDYFLVKKVLGRMEATWVTFPLIALAVSGFAYWLAGAIKGNELRVNQVEIVDVDGQSGLARGTVWTHFFSPRVRRYDLQLQPRFCQEPVTGAQSTVAWLGALGNGLGGVLGQGGQSLLDRGYRFSADREQLVGMPVQEWSTKTVVGRWRATVATPIESSLRLVAGELLEGQLVNRTGLDLQDCILMHGTWAYRLTQLPDGASRRIDGSLQPRTVKTLLTNAAAGDNPEVVAADDGTVAFDAYSTDVARKLKTMLFFEALGGQSYAQAVHRYQGFIDLSALLDGDQAILLARAPGKTGSIWRDGDSPLESSQDRQWIYYRFILPLDTNDERP